MRGNDRPIPPRATSLSELTRQVYPNLAEIMDAWRVRQDLGGTAHLPEVLSLADVERPKVEQMIQLFAQILYATARGHIATPANIKVTCERAAQITQDLLISTVGSLLAVGVWLGQEGRAELAPPPAPKPKEEAAP